MKGEPIVVHETYVVKWVTCQGPVCLQWCPSVKHCQIMIAQTIV